LVQDAAERALRAGRTQYTDATGLAALRERISAWYGTRFGLDISPQRIVVTAGASAALQLACLALVNRDDEVLLPDPSYPCNRHFVAAAEGVPVLIPASPQERFQLSATGVERAWTARTRGVLLASPSNPTGTSIDPDEMGRIVQVVRGRGGFTIVDEIYLGLSYDDRFGHSALAHGDDVISINSFSKYFSMTGWRLGWLVAPEELVPAIERLAQNLYICPSTVAQHAAIACFEPDSIAEYERRRAEFRARRDYLVPALNDMGLTVPVMPDGAFYAWADCSRYSPNSWDFSFDLMHRAHVAITPGRDFGRHGTERYVRLSYASSMAHLRDAVSRLRHALSVSNVAATP
jgi:aspartate/methionine/tyrosine aminotransferase